MEPRIEVSKFANGELKLVIRIKKSKNVWFETKDEATWVPEEDTILTLPDAYQAINEFNMKKRKEKEKQLYNKVIT